VSATTLDLHAWLESQRREVEAALDRFVPAAGDAPSIVLDAMRYALLGGGKRLRPMLALAAAEAVAERLQVSTAEARALALPAACALEMIHTYSLVHDDLPAMDNDTMRRGRPTTHVVFGDGMAILAGDALLTEAFALLAREPAGSQSVATDDVNLRKLRTTALVAAAAGAAGMVGGQALDLRAASPGATPLDAAALRDMHGRKTGALIHASAMGGAIMAGARGEQMEAIGEYARHLGLAFQIVDDILDVEGASADLGKTAGKDAAAGKPTYPALFGLAESKRLAARCLDDALAALSAAGLGGQLPAIGRWVVGRSN
jgi:geranylgeranyl diphosphate synthase type II